MRRGLVRRVQYGEAALEAGVEPGTLRAIRHRYHLAWPEWERPS